MFPSNELPPFSRQRKPLALIYQTTRCRIPEDRNPNTQLPIPPIHPYILFPALWAIIISEKLSKRNDTLRRSPSFCYVGPTAFSFSPKPTYLVIN